MHANLACKSSVRPAVSRPTGCEQYYNPQPAGQREEENEGVESWDWRTSCDSCELPASLPQDPKARRLNVDAATADSGIAAATRLLLSCCHLSGGLSSGGPSQLSPRTTAASQLLHSVRLIDGSLLIPVCQPFVH